MDLEVMINFFCGVFQHYKTDERKIFIVHDLKNDFEAFVEFLDNCVINEEWYISFNGIGFDAQITEYILQNRAVFKDMTPEEITGHLYSVAQNVIQKQDTREKPDYHETKLSIKQIDLYKLNHWDNPAKRSSLKWIQYSMDWPNLLDMPIHHSTLITTKEQIKTIVDYCINDVNSTREIFIRSKEQIALRQALTKEYGINLFSASEPKISRELFLHFLSKSTGWHKYDIRQMRTICDEIHVESLILPYIDFENIAFRQLLTNFKKLILNPSSTKGGFKYSVKYRGVKTDFGLGGLHGATTPGVYKANNDMIIMTSDVTSFYPNLAIMNRWSPGHLPKDVFCDLYKWFFDERKKIPKKDPKNYVYKIILNSTYGLSNEVNSFLYDPEFTMRITINGQLSLAMLYEMICEAIPEAIPIMQNTDGLETMIPVSARGTYLEICKKWETITQLQLEHDEYQKIVLADVNNYIAVYNYKETTAEEYTELQKKNPHWLFDESSGKYRYAATKCKGRFEFSDLALHKNKSFLIIPKAVYYYFVHGIKPEEYILLNRNILDYCAGVKIKGDWKFTETCVVDGEIVQTELQHTIRYYITKTGCKIIKENLVDGRQIQVEAGKWLQKVFIKTETKPWKSYDVDDSYYIKAAQREISNIEVSKLQLTLF
jgi:hypothetical protein